jgi:hypothetical protein
MRGRGRARGPRHPGVDEELRAAGLEDARPLLHALHVLNEDGTVSADKRRKLKQVRRMLELLEPTLDRLAQRGDPVRIVDANAGNAYLAFLVLHGLRRRGVPGRLFAYERSAEAVARTRARAAMLGFEEIEVRHADLARAVLPDAPDLVLSLHGCDTATDAALLRAVEAGAREILAVPCCQQELRPLLGPGPGFEWWPEGGILAVDLAADLSDLLRLYWLRAAGYSADCVEFVPLEHTPKNRLFRARKDPGAPQAAARQALFRLRAGFREAPWLLREGAARAGLAEARDLRA